MARPVGTLTTDTTKLQAMAKLGLSNGDIAKVVGCGSRTVTRLLDTVKESTKTLAAYRSVQVDTCDLLVASAQEYLLQMFGDEELINGLDAKAKINVGYLANVVGGTWLDKSRLLTGQSTSNNSFHLVIEQTHNSGLFSQSNEGNKASLQQAENDASIVLNENVVDSTG